MNLEQLTKINIKTDEVKDISDACKKLTSQNKIVEKTEDLLKLQQEEARRLHHDDREPLGVGVVANLIHQELNQHAEYNVHY